MSSGSRKSFLTGPGGLREVLRLALPLIVSNSFWAFQITIDRILLSRHEADNVGAALTGVVLFWSPFTLLFGTAMYTVTFVAQYFGADERKRIGPVVWQSLWFSLASGIAFLLLIPVGNFIIYGFGGGVEVQPDIRSRESTYFTCLCFAALPMLLIHSATSFFLGQGRNWIVVLVNAAGMAVNAGLDFVLISGKWGFPECGIAGAGWATVAGSWTAALLALWLIFRPKHEAEFALRSGWRLNLALFKRLIRFGLPSGLQLTAEILALNVVIFLIRQIGPAEMSATGIAFSLNVLAFLPPMGIAQAVTILVGQRLGENRPDLAARTTWSGFVLCWSIMMLLGLSFALLPNVYLHLYRPQSATAGQEVYPAGLAHLITQSLGSQSPAPAGGVLAATTPILVASMVAESEAFEPSVMKWSNVADLSIILLRFVALYCLFDSINLVFAFALKGAGDTRFVSIVTLLLAWPIMVLPMLFVYQYKWGLYVAWWSITVYVFCLATIFFLRFLQGKWKSMRVIEQQESGDGNQESGIRGQESKESPLTAVSGSGGGGSEVGGSTAGLDVEEG